MYDAKASADDVKAEDEGNTGMFIVIGMAGGVVIYFVTIWCCICYCRKKRREQAEEKQ